jgi:hypothetical protein
VLAFRLPLIADGVMAVPVMPVASLTHVTGTAIPVSPSEIGRSRMTPRGPASKVAPVGWAFLDRHREDGYTVRWRRGDTVAYVLSGQQVGNHRMTEVVDTISVLPKGWTDLAEIRLLGQRWLRGR